MKLLSDYYDGRDIRPNRTQKNSHATVWFDRTLCIHTEQAAFKVEVEDPTTKKGTRIKSFFLYSQTQPAPMAQ